MRPVSTFPLRGSLSRVREELFTCPPSAKEGGKINDPPLWRGCFGYARSRLMFRFGTRFFLEERVRLSLAQIERANACLSAPSSGFENPGRLAGGRRPSSFTKSGTQAMVDLTRRYCFLFCLLFDGLPGGNFL